MKLTLTNEQAYARKQRLWKLYLEWSIRVRRAFFPDTTGVPLYMHNWYKCGQDKAKAELAEWIDDSTYARYKRLEARLEARSARREHERHSWMKDFDPLWCPLCHPELAESYANAR